MRAFKIACDNGVAAGRAREKKAFIGMLGKKPAPKPAAPRVDVNSPENLDLWQRLEAAHLAGIGKTHGDASDDDLRTAYLSALNHPDAAHLRGAPEFQHLRNPDASMNVDQLNHLMAQYLAPLGHTQASAMDAPSSKGWGGGLWEEALMHAGNHPTLNHLRR